MGESRYAARLASSRPDMLVSSKEGAAALTSASTTTGTGLGLAKGAGAGIGICKIATASGLAGVGTAGAIVGAVITGGLGLLAGYLAYRGVKAFIS